MQTSTLQRILALNCVQKAPTRLWATCMTHHNQVTQPQRNWSIATIPNQQPILHSRQVFLKGWHSISHLTLVPLFSYKKLWVPQSASHWLRYNSLPIYYVAPCTRHRWQMHMAYGHGLNEGWSLFYAHFLYNGSRLESTSLATTRITHFDTWLESPLSNFIYYQMCHPPLAKGLKEIQGIYIMKWQKWSDSR